MIRSQDLKINDKNPFENCKLNREQYADILTTVIESYKDGFVMAINNKWGEGKTTFVKMWEQKLKNDKYETLYFNAWENDFEDNALTAIIGELKSLSDKGHRAKEDFKELLKAGAVLGKNILPGLAKALVGKYIDVDELKSFVEAATKGMTEIFEEDVKEYANKKESIKEFKVKLQKFIKDTTHNKPLIFIIDELDRCRPNYAVSVLEKVKHFFSVPGIVFILSIDKEQLGNAVKGVYGNDNIDANEYLRRFIDLEYSLSEPDTEQYSDYLYEYYNFDAFFKSTERLSYESIGEDGYIFLKVVKILFSSKRLSLRQYHKILFHSRLSLRVFRAGDYVIPTVFALLNYLKFQNPYVYNRIREKDITTEELQDEFISLIHHLREDDDLQSFLLYIEADLIYFTANYLANGKYYNNNLLYKNDINVNESRIESKIDPGLTQSLVPYFEKYIYKSLRFGLNHQINKIELAENFKTPD